MRKHSICEYFNMSERKLENIMKALAEKKYVKILDDKVYLTPLGKLVIEELFDLLAFSL